MCSPSSKNKGADQLLGYREADLGLCFCICKKPVFSQRGSYLSGAHVTHLDSTAEEELNRLLRIVVDVENLFMCVHKEEDAETKQVYFYLFKVGKVCFE